MKNVRWASFISGGGTTMAAMLDACIRGELPGVTPTLVLSSKKDAGGLEKARKRQEQGLKFRVMARERKNYSSAEEYGRAIASICRDYQIDVVTQNGWLPKTHPAVIHAVLGNIFNQHPGPTDPTRKHDFGGDGSLGMYGRRVHCARLLFVRWSARDHWTEAVAHYAVPEVDKGPIVHSRRVEILPEDTVESLQARVLPVEHEVQIETLRMFAQGKIEKKSREIPLVRTELIPLLFTAKSVAVTLYPEG